jgi:hypothetical protein
MRRRRCTAFPFAASPFFLLSFAFLHLLRIRFPIFLPSHHFCIFRYRNRSSSVVNMEDSQDTRPIFRPVPGSIEVGAVSVVLSLFEEECLLIVAVLSAPSLHISFP